MAWRASGRHSQRPCERRTPTDVRDEARDDALEVVSTQMKNQIRQFNEYAYVFVRHALTFADDVELSDVDHEDGETISELESTDLTETEDGLDPEDVIVMGGSSFSTPVESISVEVHDYELPNGESESAYHLHFGYDSAADDEITIVPGAADSNGLDIFVPSFEFSEEEGSGSDIFTHREGDSVNVFWERENGGPYAPYRNPAEILEALEDSRRH
ncbi:hypothetical protein D8S78_13315 [Natrialba swarupiae]|nr:hypothetical protein [Natrialba swarupiae]